MQPRKITVVQTKNQKKSVVMTNATTLGELKEALRETGIDYEGMTFYEGLSKTELKKDDAILPHDIERNGVVTNELVFMLTNTDKKIKSGAMLRPELYSYIKNNNLSEEVKKAFGKNFTMCKTSDLQSIVDKHKSSKKPAVKENFVNSKTEEEEVKVTKVEESGESTSSQNSGDVRKAVECLVNDLYNNDCISNRQKNNILNILNGVETSSTVDDDMSSPYSDAEISRMMREM